MFRNLDAEQARFSYTNQQMADKLGISRVSYENKKKQVSLPPLRRKKCALSSRSNLITYLRPTMKCQRRIYP